MITFEWSDWRNGVFWWIQSVYVDPAWRRQNVFRRMHESRNGHCQDKPERLRSPPVRREEQRPCPSRVP